MDSFDFFYNKKKILCKNSIFFSGDYCTKVRLTVCAKPLIKKVWLHSTKAFCHVGFEWHPGLLPFGYPLNKYAQCWVHQAID